MQGRVAVVTDSTACIGSEELLRVVPLGVVVDGVEAAEDEIDPRRVVEALQRRASVTTSSPPPRALRAAYSAAAAQGAEAIVSLHLSPAWSGTYAAASAAAAESPVPVRVVDARTLAMPLGWAAQAAARAARAGAGLGEVERVARATAGSSSLWFLVPTLEHLRRGGRIGTGAALLGTALAVKPIFAVADGQLTPVDRVRTLTRAVERLVELATDGVTALGAEGPVQVAVQHLGDPEQGEVLRGLLARVPGVDGAVQMAGVAAVIGAHVGPGVLAVAVGPAPEA